MNTPLLDLRQKLTVGDISDCRALAWLLKKHDQRNNQKANNGPKGEIPEIAKQLVDLIKDEVK